MLKGSFLIDTSSSDNFIYSERKFERRSRCPRGQVSASLHGHWSLSTGHVCQRGYVMYIKKNNSSQLQATFFKNSKSVCRLPMVVWNVVRNSCGQLYLN